MRIICAIPADHTHTSTVQATKPEITMSARVCAQRLIHWRCLQVRTCRNLSRTYTASPIQQSLLDCRVQGRQIASPPKATIFSTSKRLYSDTVDNKSGSLEREGESESSVKKGGEGERHPDAEKEPLPEWPDGVNPHTGERGGPKGPEPTRYGDWERKGRVSDF